MDGAYDADEIVLMFVAARKTRTMMRYFVFPVGGDIVAPRYRCSPF